MRLDSRLWTAALAVLSLASAFLIVDLAGARPSLEIDPRVQEAENKRIALIAKVSPSVVAIFGPGGNGGGSGVLISDDGYTLTNFHVVAGAGITMKCGLANGVLYDAVLVGVDKVGDVALIKLLPEKEGDKFPFAVLGNSENVQVGEYSLAMGNPFLLATDFTPTVTFGIVSGVHRYQYPDAGNMLEYTDCIQVDTSVNPGNSGGPLFDMNGELIGINGRISLEKRGRVNVGVGYAISINQIKNFLPQLRAGMETDHASLGMSVESNTEEGRLGRLTVQKIILGDTTRRGVARGDELVNFAGRPLRSVNQFKNVLGIYPKGWRLPLEYVHGGEKRKVLVRLQGVQRQEIGNAAEQPQPAPGGAKPAPTGPAAKLYKEQDGFANFYFNEQERNRLLGQFKTLAGDYSKVQGDWTIRGISERKGARKTEATLSVKGTEKKDGTDVVEGFIEGGTYQLQPLAEHINHNDLIAPLNSGGLLMAMYQYRLLLAYGEQSFKQRLSYGGVEPYYLPPPEQDAPDFSKMRVDCEVLRTVKSGVNCKWYFAQAEDKDRGILKHQLLGFEASLDRDMDPCEVCLLDYKPDASGRQLPTRMVVRHKDDTYLEFNNLKYLMEAAK
jgi:serine protease Do